MMTKKLKRLGLMAFVLLLVGVHIIASTGQALANGVGKTAAEEFKNEYIIWKAAYLLAGCTGNSADSAGIALDNASYQKPGNGYFLGGGDGPSEGVVFHKNANPEVKMQANDVECGWDVDDSLSKVLGFENFTKVLEDLYPRAPDKDASKNSNGQWQIRPSLLYDNPAVPPANKPNRDAYRKALQYHWITAANNGPDNSDDLSEGAKFWYWNELAHLPDSEGGCGFQFLNSSQTTEWDRHDDRNKFDAGGYHGINDQGKAEDFPRAFIDLASDDYTNLDTWDSVVNDLTSEKPSESDCGSLLNFFRTGTMERYRNAYTTEQDKLDAAAQKAIKEKKDADTAKCVAQGGDAQKCADDAEREAKAAQDAYNNSKNTAGTATGGDIAFNCHKSGNPISWILCPLVDGFAGAVNAVDSQINDMLTINTKDYFDDTAKGSAGEGFKAVWITMRTLSISFLVIIGLVMVISTAVGWGIFDAYTVKKVFPRLIAAIVAISVSWYLVIFIIDISNLLGHGIRSLIQSPFSAQFGKGVTLDGGQLSLGAIGVVGVGLALGLLGLLSLVATAFVAVAIAFVTLILRQLLVIMLAVMAPVAIAAYILPNTQKAGKLWWDFFSKALLAFPIISAFIAIGRVFAVVSQNVSGSSNAGTLRGFIGFIAYFAPYFLLPKAFAMAGGALGNLSGAINNNGKGAFDRLSGFRKNRREDRIKGFRSGGIYDKSTRRGRFGNALGGYVFDADEKIPYKLGQTKVGKPLFGRTATRMGSEIEHTALEQTQKLSQELQGMGFNAEALAATSGLYGSLNKDTRERILLAQRAGTLGTGTPRSVQDFQTLSQILSQASSETERIAGNAIGGSAGRLGNLHRDREMGYANLSAAALFERSRQGFASGEEISQVANETASEHGVGMAQAIATRAQLLGQAARPDLKAGYGVLYDKDQGFSSGVTGNKGVGIATGEGIGANQQTGGRAVERAKALIKTLKQQDIAGAKASTIKQLSGGMLSLAQETTTNSDGKVVPTEDAIAMQQTMMQNLSAYAGNDAGAKIAWRELAGQLHAVGGPDLLGRAEESDKLLAAREAAAPGSGGGGVPGAAGPTPPTSPGGVGFP